MPVLYGAQIGFVNLLLFESAILNGTRMMRLPVQTGMMRMSGFTQI